MGNKRIFEAAACMTLALLVGSPTWAQCPDQRFGSAAEFGYVVNSDWSIAQTYTAALGGKVDRIEVQVGRVGVPAAPLRLEVRTTTTGVPDSGPSAVIARAEMPPATINDLSYVAFDLSGESLVAAPGNTFAICLLAPNSSESAIDDIYYFVGDETSDYPGGTGFALWGGDSDWVVITTENASSVDFGFAVFLDCTTPVDAVSWSRVKALYH